GEDGMSSPDLKGLAVSATSADALAAYERGVDLFLRWRTGALDALDVAAQRDPRFALVHCTKAYITSRMGRGAPATAAGTAAAGRRGSGRAAVRDDARLLPRAVRLQRRGPRGEPAVPGARSDEPVHIPRGGPRLSGARRLSERAGDLRARPVLGALRAPGLA